MLTILIMKIKCPGKLSSKMEQGMFRAYLSIFAVVFLIIVAGSLKDGELAA